jgi:hypothetical protein
MDLIKIHELPEGAAIQDGHELPVSTGSNSGDVKRFSMAILKAWIIAFVTPLYADITQGPAGPVGAPGSQGIQGQKGDKGDRGDKGDQGLKGDQGPAGAIGIQGPKGDKGDKGVKGDQGTQGIQGPKGDQGDPGNAGADGPAGPAGPAGNDFNMTAYIAAAPTYASESEAQGLEPFTLYKTPTGELRYKLNAGGVFSNQFSNQFS